MKKTLTTISLLLFAVSAFAGFSVIDDTANLKVGFFNKILCSTGMTCTKQGGALKMVADVSLGSGPFTLEDGELLKNEVDDVIEFKSNDLATTLRVEGFEGNIATLELASDDGDDTNDVFSMKMDTADLFSMGIGAAFTTTMDVNGDWVFGGATPKITLGDAGAEDAGLVWDGNAQDFYMQLDDTADKLVIGLGQTAPTTSRLSFNSADLNIIVGDATAADVAFIFDGNAQDFSIGMDDSADKLTIALGSVLGTTNRMAFNSADLNIILGDATAADVSLVFDGIAQDYNIGLDDSTDDLVIGLGSAPGTTDALRIDENQVVTFLQDPVLIGTTPRLTVGDAGAEDSSVVFDGNAQDFAIGLDDTNDKLVVALGSALGTTNRMAFNSADLNIVLGDASTADVGFIYDGNAQDYNISLDDSSDDLVIGLGSVAGTTDAMRIDENQDVTFVQDILPLSTITGDGGAALVGMLMSIVAPAGTSSTATAAQCGSVFLSNSAEVITLPEASTVLGCVYVFACGTVDDMDINPADATDTISVVNVVGGGAASALAPAAGDAIRCTDIGSTVTMIATSADLWMVIGPANGPWTDVN